MTNLFDYLTWRGDLTLKQAKFNNVDALILARLSYLAFDDIVSSSFDERISVYDAAFKFFSQDKKAIEKNLILPDDPDLLRALSYSERFKNMKLLGYVNEINTASEKQFSAITIQIDENEYFVSYRGTDSTLVGWKEDFNMSFMDTVPAQISAKTYLNDFARVISSPTYVAGHSKGGNLAVYSSAFCNPEVQNQIKKIYNFDGPGFNTTILEKDSFQNILSKINTYVPQASIVGMILEHKGDYNIVHSYQDGIMQHDLYSWEIKGEDFIYMEATTEDSVFYDKTLTDWLSNTTKKQREDFIDVVYQILLSTDGTTINMLDVKWYKAAKTLIKSYITLDEDSKNMVSIALKELMSSANKNYKLVKPKLAKL